MKILVSVGLLGLLIAAVHHWVGWGQLLLPWTHAPLGGLWLASALVLASYALRALRLFDYFWPLTRGGYPACLRLMLIHNALNNLLPMRAGEVSFPVLMHRYFGLSLLQATGALLWFRVLDLHAMVGIGGLAVGWHGLGVGVVGLMLAWWSLPWWLYRGLPVFRRGFQGIAVLEKLYAGLPGTPGLFWRSWFWTQLNWGLKLVVFAWVLTVFLPLPGSWALAGVMGGELTSVLPIHGVAGAGTYEAGILAALAPLGLSVHEALQGAVNLHVFMLGLSLLAAGASLALPLPRRAGE